MVDEKHPPGEKRGEANRRGYARVDDLLKIDYRKISQREYERYQDNQEGIFATVFGEPLKIPEMEEIDLKLLYKLAYQANLKMDRILEILGGRDAEQYASAGIEYVNISGSGMKFTANRSFSTGDIIALRIFLPLDSSTWMTLLGKVTSCAQLSPQEGYSVAVHFVGLSEDDREMIIKYVFKRQRELLRVTSDMKDQG